MSRSLSLLFAVIGTALLLGIPAAMSYRNGLAVLLFSLASIAFLGFAFATKAKLRRKNEQSSEMPGPRSKR